MTHQLKPNDAVKCNSPEEWSEVIRLAALHGIIFYSYNSLPIFESCPIIIGSNDRVIYFYSEEELGKYLLANLNFHSFQDFCAKIKGEYKSPEFFLYVSRDREVRVISSDDPNVPAIMLPPGKYKLTRVDE